MISPVKLDVPNSQEPRSTWAVPIYKPEHQLSVQVLFLNAMLLPGIARATEYQTA